jgi:hypothetical protein
LYLSHFSAQHTPLYKRHYFFFRLKSYFLVKRGNESIAKNWELRFDSFGKVINNVEPCIWEMKYFLV